MCRNIRTLHNYEPPATEEEIRASALQYVRKISGFTKPSQANAEAFEQAVDAISETSAQLLDELPTATLRNRSGTRIDARRFPGFANLAAHSTWYRNNTTVADFTGRAVPAIETGIDPDYNTLPISSQQPHSIFTLLGGKYRFN